MSTTKAKAAKTPAEVYALSQGEILSETSFYTVKGFNPDGSIVVTDDLGHDIKMGRPYIEQICQSANHYTSTEEKSMTELAEIFLSHPRIAMSVCYITKPEEKTAKDFKAEKEAKITQIQNAPMKDAARLLEELIENPITKFIPGHERIIKGRHYGHQHSTGRVNFIDMEIKASPSSKDYDTRTRQVDTRTIQWLIVNKVKYVLKH